MSFIGRNIKKIRTVKKLSQAAFAQLFNLARPSVGAYEEGRSEPKLDTIIQMAAHFGLSVDVLLTKELTINDLYKFNLHVDKRLENGGAQKADIHVVFCTGHRMEQAHVGSEGAKTEVVDQFHPVEIGVVGYAGNVGYSGIYSLR